jgi:hypothetical protein
MLRAMFDTELRLSLTCAKSVVDSFLAAHPKLFTDAGFNSSVAVVARVVAIRSERVPKGGDEIGEARIGEGECLRLLYVGNVVLDR